MRVEIDPAELDGAFYKDDKCREIEEILRKDFRYKECEVKREFCGEDAPNDPFVVRNKHGENIVTLEEWEIDALNGSELASFISVQQKREQYSDKLESISFKLFLGGVSITGLFLVMSLQIVLMLKPVPEALLIVTLASSILMALSGIVYYLKRKLTILKRGEIDLEAARNDSSFLGALRKLAAVPKTAYVDKDEHISRLEYIENAMNEINS